MAGKADELLNLPESITLRDDDDDSTGGLRLYKRETKKGVIVYSVKIDWRDPYKKLDDD